MGVRHRIVAKSAGFLSPANGFAFGPAKAPQELLLLGLTGKKI
jgi:hypothetical protein